MSLGCTMYGEPRCRHQVGRRPQSPRFWSSSSSFHQMALPCPMLCDLECCTAAIWTGFVTFNNGSTHLPECQGISSQDIGLKAPSLPIHYKTGEVDRRSCLVFYYTILLPIRNLDRMVHRVSSCFWGKNLRIRAWRNYRGGSAPHLGGGG